MKPSCSNLYVIRRAAFRARMRIFSVVEMQNTRHAHGARAVALASPTYRHVVSAVSGLAMLAFACLATTPRTSHAQSPAAPVVATAPDATPQVQASPAPSVGVRRDDVQTFLLPSTQRDATYLIQVAVPAQTPPPRGWPVVYVLDGNAAFEHLFNAGEQGMQTRDVQAVVVGIGYEDTRRFNQSGRSYDYTPPSPGDHQPVGSPRDPTAKGRSLPGGGAAYFLSFIRQDLEPHIQRRFPVDEAKRTLFGHSYGGLFVLYAYLTAPTAFDYFVAASPSLWWNDRYIEQLAERFIANPPARAGDLTLWVGSNEIADAPVARTIVGLSARLDEGGLRSVHQRVFPGLGHGPMSAAALDAVLQAQVGR